MDSPMTLNDNNSDSPDSPSFLNHKPILHVEALLSPKSTCRFETIRKHVESFLISTHAQVFLNSEIREFDHVHMLRDNIEVIRICEANGTTPDLLPLSSITLQIHVYQLNFDPYSDEYTGQDGDDPMAEPMSVAASHWMLPSAELEGIWDSLIFDEIPSIKTRLLDYVYTAMLFSDRGVNANVVTWNRVALLHGPPGTGKTSLCKALAQKLSIRLADRYSHSKLIEINSHSLFSKWFSESGKLVMRMFDRIRELAEDEDAFVCILIDEVESLTAARTAALNGTEPGDAVRVVNALLTQLDKLKSRKNVLVLATSNITEAIDIAFIDRADIKAYIPLPSHRAAYSILLTCLQELVRVGIVVPNRSGESLDMVDWRTAELYESEVGANGGGSGRLLRIARESVGMSGRTLRKLPFLAHSYFLQAPSITLNRYLHALERTVREEQSSKKLLNTRKIGT